MKSIKQAYKYIALILVLSMILGSMVVFADTSLPNDVSNVQSFSDVLTDHWAYENIEELVKRGAITGYPDGKFRPDLTVTRAEFAKIMVKAADLTLKAITTSSFADIKTTDWYNPYIEAAKGYMTGYKDQTGKTIYKPNSAALREDIVVAIVKLKGYDVRFADVGMLEVMYKDYSSISASARSYVAIAVEKGLISGFPDETFRAQATITRAQVATILWRAFQYGNDDKVTGDDITEPSTESTETTTEDSTQPEDTSTDKYSVKTLASNISTPDSMVVDNKGIVYILQDNKIKRIESGKVTVVADGNKDFVLKVNIGQIAQEIYESSNDSSARNNMEGYLDINDEMAYKKFTINQLIYDNKSDKVYAWGFYYNSIDNITTDDYTYLGTPLALFNIDNGISLVTRYFLYNYLDNPEFYRGNTAIFENNVLYFGFWEDRYIYRYDISSGSITQFSDCLTLDVYPSKIVIISSKFYFLKSINYDIRLYEYNLQTSSVKKIYIDNEMKTNYEVTTTYSDSCFYIASGGIIYTLDVTGNVVEYMKASDFIIKDGLPISNIQQLIIDNDGSVIFYDTTNRAIRKIHN